MPDLEDVGDYQPFGVTLTPADDPWAAAGTPGPGQMTDADRAQVSRPFGPSWYDRALEQSKRDAEAYRRGGVPEMFKDIGPTMDLAGGFVAGGTTKAALFKAGGEEGAALAAPTVLKRLPVLDDAGMPVKGRAFDNAAEQAHDLVAASPKGYGPLDLSLAGRIPNVPQEELPRIVPPRGVSPRMIDALSNPQVNAGVEQSIRDGVASGMDKWYHTEPIRAAWEKELGEDGHVEPFKLSMDLQSAVSPKSNVPTQIRNGSWMYMHAMQGTPLPPKGPEIYPYGHLGANLHRQNFETVTGPGWDVLQNPKPPSFSANLQGNLVPGTMDTHAFRNIGMRTNDPRFLATQLQEIVPQGRQVGEDSAAAKYGEWGRTKPNGDNVVIYRPQKLFAAGKLSMDDALKISPFWASQPNENEYGAAERFYRSLGEKHGLATADAQSAAWAGGGDLTGLGTAADRTFPELMNERIMYTSHLRRMDPGQVLSDFIRGKRPLLGLAGIAGGADAIHEHTMHLPIEHDPHAGDEAY